MTHIILYTDSNSNLNKTNHEYDYFIYPRTPPVSKSMSRCIFGMFSFDIPNPIFAYPIKRLQISIKLIYLFDNDRK